MWRLIYRLSHQRGEPPRGLLIAGAIVAGIGLLLAFGSWLWAMRTHGGCGADSGCVPRKLITTPSLITGVIGTILIIFIPLRGSAIRSVPFWQVRQPFDKKKEGASVIVTRIGARQVAQLFGHCSVGGLFFVENIYLSNHKYVKFNQTRMFRSNIWNGNMSTWNKMHLQPPKSILFL